MRALNRKLLRDLWALKTQVASIALVMACGLGAFIGSFSEPVVMRTRSKPARRAASSTFSNSLEPSP